MSSTSQIIVVSVLTLGLLACTDSVTRFEDFGDRVVDGGVAAPEPDAEPLIEVPNINGTFLLGLAAVISPEPPFQFLADVELDGNTVTISLRGLDRFTRMLVDAPPLAAEGVPVDITGRFEAVLQGEIPGDANVLTGSTLTVDVTLIGRIRSEDMFCGDANGMILAPIELDITGSTIGAIRVEDGVVGDQLPDPLSACPE